MIFLRVEHTNDDDADYFKFDDLQDCINYIYREDVFKVDYTISTRPQYNIPEDDYTYVIG